LQIENLKTTTAMIMIMYLTIEKETKIYPLVFYSSVSHLCTFKKDQKKIVPVKVETSKGTTES